MGLIAVALYPGRGRLKIVSALLQLSPYSPRTFEVRKYVLAALLRPGGLAMLDGEVSAQMHWGTLGVISMLLGAHDKAHCGPSRDKYLK